MAKEVEVTRWPGLTAVEISVLIPCWHAELTIGGALDSVEAQQGLPEQVGVEVVVVVDGRQEDRQARDDVAQAQTLYPIHLLKLGIET